MSSEKKEKAMIASYGKIGKNILDIINKAEEKKKTVINPGIEQAFSEVYQVIEHLDPPLRAKVPEEFTRFLSDNMDKDWTGNLDFSVSLNSKDLLKDSRVILSLVYRDFLCSEAKRKELIVADRKAIEAAGEQYEEISLMDFVKNML